MTIEEGKTYRGRGKKDVFRTVLSIADGIANVREAKRRTNGKVALSLKSIKVSAMRVWAGSEVALQVDPNLHDSDSGNAPEIPAGTIVNDELGNDTVRGQAEPLIVDAISPAAAVEFNGEPVNESEAINVVGSETTEPEFVIPEI